MSYGVLCPVLHCGRAGPLLAFQHRRSRRRCWVRANDPITLTGARLVRARPRGRLTARRLAAARRPLWGGRRVPLSRGGNVAPLVPPRPWDRCRDSGGTLVPLRTRSQFSPPGPDRSSCNLRYQSLHFWQFLPPAPNRLALHFTVEWAPWAVIAECQQQERSHPFARLGKCGASKAALARSFLVSSEPLSPRIRAGSPTPEYCLVPDPQSSRKRQLLEGVRFLGSRS